MVVVAVAAMKHTLTKYKEGRRLGLVPLMRSTITAHSDASVSTMGAKIHANRPSFPMALCKMDLRIGKKGYI